MAVIASKINVNNTVDTVTLESELNNQFGTGGWTYESIDGENAWKVVVNGKIYKIDLTTGAIEKVTGIIISANPSNVLVGETATITLALDGIDKTGDISFTANPSSSATISNINQTAEGATATVTILEGKTDSVEIEGKLDDDNKAECTITIIVLDVTNAEVDSNLEVEIGSTLDIVNCITNKICIEEFTITNVTGNATKENDTTIKGTGTADGTATVTITGTQSGKTKDIAVTVIKPEVLEVGSYVNYPVDYDNVETSGSGKYIPKDEYAGKWRILDLGNYDENTKTYSNTKIVSAGVPLTYYHPISSASTCATKLTTGFFTTQINTETKTSRKYYRCGFKNGNTTLTDIGDVQNLFKNNITAKDSSNNPVVQAMTKADLDKVYDPTGATTTAGGTYVKDAKFNDLLAIPSKDQSGKYAHYWLASAYYGNDLWLVHYIGSVGSNDSGAFGVRPVVSLQSGISITKGTNGWDISIPNNS